MNVFSRAIRNLFEADDLRAEVENNNRLVEIVMPVALNAGRQMASLLEANPLDVTPVLGSDSRSAVVEFETLTFRFAPFDEVVVVGVRETTESAVFPMFNGLLTRDVQNQILGMLHRSLREDKTLGNTLSLKGDRPQVRVMI